MYQYHFPTFKSTGRGDVAALSDDELLFDGADVNFDAEDESLSEGLNIHV